MKENILSIWWIDRIHLVNPNKEDIDFLVKKYDLHDLIIEDLLELNTQDKIDVYDRNIFIVLHFPKYNQITQRYMLNEFDAILWKNFIITVTRFPTNHIYKIRQEYQKEIQNWVDEEFKISPYYILYRILDAMYDKVLNLLTKFSKDIIEIEERMLTTQNLKKDILEKLMIKKRNIIFLKHMFQPQQEITEDLAEEITKFYEWELEVYFEDISYKLDKIINNIWIIFENVDSLTEIYNSLMNIKINSIITILTIFTAIVWIHTLIAWIYWMNVILPLSEYPYTFWLLLFLMILITFFVLWIFKKLKWI